MRLLQATSWGYDTATLSPTAHRSVDKHNTAVRSGSFAVNNQTGLGGLGTLVPGLRGTGQAWTAPVDFKFQYNNVSALDPPLTLANVFCVFKLGTSAATQQIVSIAGTGNTLNLTTNASSQLIATVGGVVYTSAVTVLSIDTVYTADILVKLGDAGTGSFEVRLNGLTITALSKTGVTVDGGLAVNGGKHISAITWNNANLTVGEQFWRGGTEAFSTSLFLGGGLQGKIPGVTDLAVVGDGAYTNALKWSGSFAGSADSTYTDDWQQLAEATFDAETHYLRHPAVAGGSAPVKQSWVYAPFAPAVDVVTIDSVLQHIICAGGGNTEVGLQFLRIGRTDYRDPTMEDSALSIGGVLQWGWVAFAGSGWGGNSMAYSQNPATVANWEIDELQGLEGGCIIERTDATRQGNEQDITQAVLSVVWVEGELVIGDSSPTQGGTCVPCTTTLNTYFFDSGLTYQGNNSVDGGITQSTSTMTLSINPAGNWTTVGGEHLLTCSTALFTAGDAFYVGKAIRLTGTDGLFVVCDIIDHNVGDTTLDVTIRSAVPASLQATATDTWALMIEVLTLAHLEGQTVGAVADGIDQGQFVVASSIITLADHAAIIHAGLPIRAIFQTLPISAPSSPDAIEDKPKDVVSVTVFVEESKNFELGSDETHLDPVDCNPNAATPTELFTGKVVNVSRSGHTFEDQGRTRIEQNSPFPLKILGIISNVILGKR